MYHYDIPKRALITVLILLPAIWFGGEGYTRASAYITKYNASHISPELTLPHSESVNAISFSLDGKYLLEEVDGRAEVRRTHGWQKVGSYSSPTAIAKASPDGRYLATVEKEQIHLRTMPDGKRDIRLDGGSSDVKQIMFSQDGFWLYSLTQDGEFRSWDIREGANMGRSPNRAIGGADGKPIKSFSVSLDGKHVATSDGSAVITIHDPMTLRGEYMIKTDLLFVRTYIIKNGRIAVVGNLPISVSESPPFGPVGVEFWDIPSRIRLGEWVIPGTMFGSKPRLSFTPDARRLAVSIEGGDAYIYDLKTHTETTIAGGSGALCKFSPNGRILATGAGSGIRGVIMLWNASTGANIAELRGKGDVDTSGKISDLSFAPDGTRIAASSVTGETLLWRVPSSS